MKKVIIIGAGSAGLTAAYELLEKTDIIPIIVEASFGIGGLSKKGIRNKIITDKSSWII